MSSLKFMKFEGNFQDEYVRSRTVSMTGYYCSFRDAVPIANSNNKMFQIKAF